MSHVLPNDNHVPSEVGPFPGLYDDMLFRIAPGTYHSRDYELPVIPCRVSDCPCNHHERCEMPSAIQIGADGTCEMARRVTGCESSRSRSLAVESKLAGDVLPEGA